MSGLPTSQGWVIWQGWGMWDSKRQPAYTDRRLEVTIILVADCWMDDPTTVPILFPLPY